MSRIKRFWSSEEEKSYLKWIARILWAGAILGILAGFFIIISVANSDLPGFDELENPQYDLASIIYDSNDEPFGKYFIENREFIDFGDLSPNITDALLSVEDERYLQHSGIDFRALVRVGVKSVLLRQGSSGGGSTITQQLAKLLFKRSSLRGKSSIGRAVALATIKFKEWITAVRLERRYTKEEIIAMYLNKFEFINGAHGIHSAAEIYFGKDQKDVSVEEAAVLAGMLQNPSHFNPIRFAERTTNRRNTVLDRMAVNDKFSIEERDSLKSLPLDMSNFKRKNQSEGVAPYFRAELTKWLRPLLNEKEYKKPDGTTYDIYRDGLKIYTTIDTRYQVLAEEAVKEHLKELQERYWRVWRYKDPFTFEAEGAQEALRLESVERRIRDTDLYRALYEKRFSELSKTSEDKFGIALKEPTIRRLQKDRNYISNIDSDVRGKFQRLIKSAEWKNVSSTWKLFTSDVSAAFEEMVEAKLFSYEDIGYEIKNVSRRDSLLHHLRHLQAGLLSLDAKTGEIKAWVGGPSHEYFKYDHVTMRRQVGSTIKPFIYATAIGVQGISPCQEFQDIQYTIAPGDANFNVDAEWSPANANGTFTQNRYNLYQGLLYSKNSITVRIIKELGTVDPIRELLHNVGIDKNERINNDGRLLIPRVPSIGLGSVDLSLLEMAGAYTTFANNGVYTKPTFVSRIEDKNGKILYQSGREQRRALNALYNSVMVDMLRNNVGGGYGLGLKTPAGGKTGTTNDYADGWFMGITPELVTGIWVGGDEKWVRFYTLDEGQGFVVARPIFKKYMQKVEADSTIAFNTNAKFFEPPFGFRDLTDCSRYKQIDPVDELNDALETQADLDEFDEIDLGEEFDIELEEEPMELDSLQL